MAECCGGDQAVADAPPPPLPLSVSTELQLLVARWPSRAGGSPGTMLSTDAEYRSTGMDETVVSQPSS